MTRPRNIADSINRINSSAADATAVTIDSSERVFVGNTNNDTNPASTGNATNKGATFGGASDPYLSIGRAGNAPIVAGRIDSDGDIIFFYADGTNNGAIGGGPTFLTVGGSSTFMYYQSNVIGPCGSSSGATKSNQIDLGASTTTFKDLYLGGGAYLGGTAGGNHLDDYEEGTWTPTLTGTATALAGIFHASYIKVGRKVTAQAYIQFASDSDGSAVKITMPFNSHNVTSGWQAGVIAYNTGFTGDHIIIQPNSNSLEIRRGSGGNQRLYSEYSQKYIIFGITYITA